MGKIKTVSIGITAYNSEKNIKRLIVSILKQAVKEVHFEKLLIHSDCSSDKTVSIAKSIENKKIEIIESKKRIGFAGSVENVLKKNSSDVIILLNDDIIIEDDMFIEEIVIPFLENERLGLVSANLVPFQPENFIENAVRSGYMGYSNFAKQYKNGHNILTCDGKVLALSRQFLKVLQLPKNFKRSRKFGYIFIRDV